MVSIEEYMSQVRFIEDMTQKDPEHDGFWCYKLETEWYLGWIFENENEV